MAIHRRDYQGEADNQQMLALAHARPEDNLHVTDLPYRLSSWAFDAPENVGLWVDEGGELVAWAVLQTPFWTMDIVCRPDAPPDLYRWALAWADARASEVRDAPGGRPIWFVNVYRRQEARRRDLEAAGFADQGDVGENAWSKVLLRRSLSDPVPQPTLPEGFRIRPLAGVSEVGGYTALHRAAFGSDSMTEDWRRRTLERPEYIPAIDLVATVPNGRLAAFCVCWFDPAGRGGQPSGQIEPMGVGPDFQQQGLGRALLCEGLRRLHGLGAEQIFVESNLQSEAALGLYQSVGFQSIEDVQVYRKDYPSNG